MVKTLRKIGNSYGLILDKPILDLYGITPETMLAVEPSPDGKGLIIRPLPPGDRSSRIRASAERVMATHEDTLRKLAE